MTEEKTVHDPMIPNGSLLEEDKKAPDTVTPSIPRTEENMRSHSDGYNEATEQSQLIHEQLSSAMNWHVIRERYLAGRARDISAEPKEKGAAFIIGSGPSLDDAIPHLKRWKGGIICTTSHAMTLMHHGIVPTHIVCLDPFNYWDQVKGVDWTKTKTKLVITPGCWPDLVKNWPNEILLYLQNPDRPDNFYLNEQKCMYTWREHEDPVKYRAETFHFMVRTWFPIFACSPPMQLFIADFLGYSPIFLSGLDFGCPGGKARFTGWQIGEDGTWTENAHPYTKAMDEIIANNGIPTVTVHLYYKKNFLSAWRYLCKTAYSTDHGIMPEVPYVDVETVVNRQGENFKLQSPEKIKHIADKYLASIGSFAIETKLGTKFIECPDPWTVLPQWMAHQNRILICENCKNTASINNDTDITVVECPSCHQKKLVRLFDCDIRGTMLRIDHFIKGKMKDQKEIIMYSNSEVQGETKENKTA